MRGFLGFSTYIVKTATLILSVSSGLLLGQEGPMILTAGTAIGMATAFNSPITGVLFTLEEVSETFITYPKSYIFSSFCTPNRRCIFPSLYAVVGSAAVLGGITQMTVCVVVMMIEITGKLSYILPLILAVTLSKWVSNALYEQISVINHLPHLSNKDEISVSLTAIQGHSLY
ncbi:hypothetical protein RF11_12654 [Thelohanellus kitauei]|uniref:Uncharacterized protein n=1 Tax=Thelohanellus kitauei TaxID=669202 RepID=A0A0C2MR95_THEKT|nr:hypothetical protein RF11_12654 [Thelohanellus kitauei]